MLQWGYESGTITQHKMYYQSAGYENKKQEGSGGMWLLYLTSGAHDDIIVIVETTITMMSCSP